MKKVLKTLGGAIIALSSLAGQLHAQNTAQVTVTVENIAPNNGVVLTPMWVGFHSGSFDSYNGGLRSVVGLERVAEDGNNAVISRQFLNIHPNLGGLTYIDNSGPSPVSRVVRTGDLTDVNRQDATLGPAPLRPGQTVSETFDLVADGSNDFFSYASMVLPTNDFFIANGNPRAHDISTILAQGGEISFFVGTAGGDIMDAGTELEDFEFSAGNGLFPGRNLPAGQSRPNQGRTTHRPIVDVLGNPFTAFRLISVEDRIMFAMARRAFRLFRRTLLPFRAVPGVLELIEKSELQLEELEASVTVDVEGLDFNQYADGIARITITAVPQVAQGFSVSVAAAEVEQDAAFVAAADLGNLYFNIHTADFPGGEIRGQLDTVIADRTVGGIRRLTLGAILDAEQEPDDASDSLATGEAIVKIVIAPDGTATYSADLSVEGIAVDELIPVAIFSAIHLHNAPRGVNGPVVQDVIIDAGGTATDFSVLESN